MQLSQCLERRHNNYDLLRLIFALMVIVGHAYALVPEAPAGGDFVYALLGFEYAGSLAVKFFFFLSGLMVTHSLATQARVPAFAAARVLRVFPALAACTLLCMFVLGPALSRLPAGEYLQHPDTWRYANNILLKLQFNLPGVFEGQRSTAVNGSLWTLPSEVYCYAMLAALSLLGLLATPRLGSLLCLGVIAAGFAAPEAMQALKFGGEAQRLPACFALGALLALNGERVEVRASIAAGLLLLTVLLRHSALLFQPLVYLSAFYGVLVLASWPRFMRLRPPGDFSYGVYLYGFPVQQLAVACWPQWGIHTHQLFGMAAALLLAIPSWYLLEQPILQWGRGWIRRQWQPAPAPA